MKLSLSVVVILALAHMYTCIDIPFMKYPLHASCKIDWTWSGVTCDEVKAKLVSQIQEWSNEDGCKNGGQRCLYDIVSQNDALLKATHTTPVKRYIDDMTFTFKARLNACDVNGFSTSRLWYAVLDYGTNYCNLRNLVEGAGLHEVAGFQERTEDKVCTQYSSRNCDVY